ncbi:MAG: roadblock/LC7 domain-containing protein [Candidatus Helarchaeota archaeon]|nr:roadblock/LC7 domain-containing protein [Candidatus Helarchaeota archaeon]
MEQQLSIILKKVSKRVELVVVVDKNGLPIMSLDTQTKKNIDPSRETVVAGIGAAVLSLAESTSSVVDQGALKELIIKNENGTIILLDAGKSAILIGILPPKAGIDNALISLKIAANSIAKLQIIPSRGFPKPEVSDIFVPDID